MHAGATIVYKDGKTGSLDCGFDHATTEAFQVDLPTGVPPMNLLAAPSHTGFSVRAHWIVFPVRQSMPEGGTCCVLGRSLQGLTLAVRKTQSRMADACLPCILQSS